MEAEGTGIYLPRYRGYLNVTTNDHDGKRCFNVVRFHAHVPPLDY